MMNHRERVINALDHREPDRIPIDLGSTIDSTIHATSYQNLRQSLGLPPSTTRVVDVLQQGAMIDQDVRSILDVDLVPVIHGPRRWRVGNVADGSPAELPEGFQPELLEDGSQIVRDSHGNPSALMPSGGHYFDPVYAPLADVSDPQEIEHYRDLLVGFDTPSYWDKTYKELAREAKVLRERTDYGLVGYFGGHILQAGQVLRGWEMFLMDLMVNKPLAHAIMDVLLEANLERMDRYASTVGQYVDVIHFEEDLGMQDRPLMSPRVFREMLKPYMSALFSHTKSKCGARILLHTDGAVSAFIPDFIEMGIDAINPVQLSATGMDAKELKREFGHHIAFWGAGCDSQAVLPFGSIEDVVDNVRQVIQDLSPCGGFVFAPIHNIQPDVPIENVIAMYNAARAFG